MVVSSKVIKVLWTCMCTIVILPKIIRTLTMPNNLSILLRTSQNIELIHGHFNYYFTDWKTWLYIAKKLSIKNKTRFFKINLNLLNYQLTMISAYALVLVYNFESFNGEIKLDIISRRYSANFKAIKMQVWNSYYQQLIAVNIVFLLTFLLKRYINR